MERVLKWAIPVVILAALVSAWSGLSSSETALLIGGLAELILLAVALRFLVLGVRRYRRDRAAGLDIEAALEEGLAILLPRRVAHLAAIEPRIWICLVRWLRRQPLKPGEYSYHKRSTMTALVMVVLVTSPVELFLAEILIPWVWLRLVLLIAAAYTGIWILGWAASLSVLPHSLETYRLRLRYGFLAEGIVPYSQIAEVIQERRNVPKKHEGLSVAPEDGAAYLAIGGRTDVTLRLCVPVNLQGLVSPTAPVTTIHLAVDKPDTFRRELLERMSTVQHQALDVMEP